MFYLPMTHSNEKKSTNHGILFSFLFRLISVLVFLFVTSVDVEAKDTINLSIYQPLTMQDAYPTSFGKVTVETSVRWDKTSDDRNIIQARPVIKYGALEHFQIAVAAPYSAGNDTTSGSGSAIIGSLYQFAEDKGILPALAVSASLRPYYGTLQGLETNTGLAATKSLTGDRSGLSVHLNVELRHLFDGPNDQALNRIRLVGGASLPVENNLTVLADIVHEDNRTPRETSTFAEGGFRLQVARDTVFSSGVGIGLTSQSFQTRIIVGLQYGFRP